MVKILIVKPRPGSIKSIFNKITTINQKNGPFDLLICLSDLFNINNLESSEEEIDQLINNQIPIPIRTFCMMGQFQLPPKVRQRVDSMDGRICDNLEILGHTSITTLSTLSNLRIATFSGVFDPSRFSTPDDPTQAIDNDARLHHIRANDLSTFISKLKPPQTSQPSKPQPPIDILLTHSLPQLLTLHSKRLPKNPNAPAWGCAPITEVLRHTRPRYHFAGGSEPEFWEREPWVWDETRSDSKDQVQVTRFVNLGEFGNKEKERWFYAFNLNPIGETPIIKPVDATICPYSLTPVSRIGQKRPAQDDGLDSGPNFRFAESDLKKRARTTVPPQNYVCKICENPGHWIQECPSKADNARKPPDGYVCKLCNIPGHRIQDCPVGAEQAKQAGGQPKGMNRRTQGPREIAPDTCWFCLSNPQVTKHLIASIGSECYLSLPKGQLPDTKTDWPVPGGGHVLLIPIAHYPSLLGLPNELAIPIVAEIENYKSSLKRCFSAYSATLLSFEIVKLSNQGHAHIQICPIPSDLSSSKIEEVFRSEGSRMGIEFIDEETFMVHQKENGLKGDQLSYFKVGLPDETILFHLIKPHERFNVQFGRLVLAKILGTPGRSDWKACTKSDEEEKMECQAFQKAFAAYEPKFD